MSIWGSLIGGMVGLSLGGPFGMLLGSIIGGKISRTRSGAGNFGAFAQPQQVFALSLIVLSAKLSKADGQVSKEELIAVKDKLKIPENEINNVIGNWRNSKILIANSQISPLSGSIKKQTVNLLKKEMIELYGKSYEVLHFKLRSKNENLPKEKKLNFDICLDPQKGLIVKIAYERMGKWEYRLKNFE